MNGIFCRPKSRIFGVHLLVRGVEFDTQAGGFEALLYLLGVGEVLVV